LLTLADLNMNRGRSDHAADLLTRAAAAKPDWFQRVHVELLHARCDLMAGRVEAAATRASTTMELAERTEDLDLVAHAVDVAGKAALASGATALADEIFARMVALAREHELSLLGEALTGLAVVAVLRGDLAVARSCRADLHRKQLNNRWLVADIIAHAHLACAFVDLADGDAQAAAAMAVLVDAERHEQLYVRVLSLELLAACVAASDSQRATELLTAADEQRAAIGATAWPLEPFRHVALRTLEGLAADRISSYPSV
jgi:hypothetical protein